MANHEAGEVERTVRGRRCTFRLGINEMIELQNALGLAGKDDQFTKWLIGNHTLAEVRLIFAHALRRDWPEVTEIDAGDVMTSLGVNGLKDVLAEIIRWAMPERETESTEVDGPQAKKKGGKPRPSGGPTS